MQYYLHQVLPKKKESMPWVTSKIYDLQGYIVKCKQAHSALELINYMHFIFNGT